MTVIFNEENKDTIYKYHVKGCEKVIVVRGDGSFTLNIETQSKNDPRSRSNFVFGPITGSQDICVEQFPCLACGMIILFTLTPDATNPTPNVFVEVLEDTCVPEKCCEF